MAGSLQTTPSGTGRGGVPTQGNRLMAALVTTADGDLALTPTVSQTPRNDSNVRVEANGVNMQVANGDAERTISECYFSGDGGTTARTISAIQSGDELYWNGSVAGYQLGSTDRVAFLYDI